MKVAIYARVSTKDKGQSTDNQLPDLRRYAEANGYTIYKEYAEEESGSTANRTALNDVLAELTPAEKKSRAIKHALDVRSALALGNYNRFFRLYLDTPNMGAYLMDMFVVRERLAAMAFICKA